MYGQSKVEFHDNERLLPYAYSSGYWLNQKCVWVPYIGKLVATMASRNRRHWSGLILHSHYTTGYFYFLVWSLDLAGCRPSNGRLMSSFYPSIVNWLHILGGHHHFFPDCGWLYWACSHVFHSCTEQASFWSWRRGTCNRFSPFKLACQTANTMCDLKAPRAIAKLESFLGLCNILLRSVTNFCTNGC